MPLPLIAVALIGIGTATGGTGVGMMGKGALAIKRAKESLEESTEQLERRQAALEAHIQETNSKLNELGTIQQEALETVVLRMGEFLRRHGRQVREGERLLVDGIDITRSQVPGLTKLDADPVTWIRGALSSAMVGSGTVAGVSTATTTFGVASTGTAISGLSGAAAHNATLAFLGGGSLASGGGGMALGAASLNFVTAGPALLVGGFVAHNRGQKAMTRAQESQAEMAVACQELDLRSVQLDTVEMRAQELIDLLKTLATRAIRQLDELESEPFSPEIHDERFQRALMLVLAVRDLASTTLLTSDGEINDAVTGITVKYRPMTQENPDG